MCVVSNVGDYYSDKTSWPTWPTQVPFPARDPIIPAPVMDFTAIISQQTQINELKKQVQEMKAQLEAAKAQDIADGNPDCEMEEKVIILKKIAKLFDVSLDEIFPNEETVR